MTLKLTYRYHKTRITITDTPMGEFPNCIDHGSMFGRMFGMLDMHPLDRIECLARAVEWMLEDLEPDEDKDPELSRFYVAAGELVEAINRRSHHAHADED